jgi:hypothetical protein
MKPNIERLKKLLTHMESGQLSVDKFDFGCFRNKISCSTVGCMAGELPTVFPEDWTFKQRSDVRWMYFPVLKSKDDINPHSPFMNQISMRHLEEFFELAPEQCSALFVPSDGDDGGRLTEEATREEVTENLKQFIEEQEKEQTIV